MQFSCNNTVYNLDVSETKFTHKDIKNKQAVNMFYCSLHFLDIKKAARGGSFSVSKLY